MNSGVPSGAPGAEVARIGNYVLGQTIGAGSSASVRLATHRKTNAQVAVKIISKRAAADSLVKKIAREAPIMRLLRHVNIVRLYDVIDTTEYLYLVTEYAAGGELFDHLIVHGKMSETQARDVFRQIVSAVQYCHSRKIVHRDLKAENILFDSQMNVKLIDFGFSRQCDIDDALTSFCGTPIYAAPELLQRKPYSGPRADAWSLGILLYVMLTGAYPFAGTTLPLIRKQAIVGDFDIPSYLSVDCARLVMGLLEPNAEQRLTLEEVMTSDPWFTDHSKRLMKVAAATPRTSNSFLECLVRWETARKMRALGYVDAEITVAMELSSASEAAATYHLIADTFREQVNDPSILMCAAEAYQAEQREAKLLAQQQQQQQHQQQQQQQQQTGSSNSASRVASRSVSNVSSVAIGAVNNNGEPVYMNLLTVPGSSVSGGVPVGLLVDDVTTSSSSDVHSATPQSPTHLTSPTSVQSNMTGLSSVASMRSNASSMIPEDAETRRQRTLQKIEVPTFLIKDDETGEGVDSRESDDEENAEEVLVPKRGGSAGPAHSDENPTTVFTPPASKSTSREENDAAAAGTRGGKSVLVRKRSNSSPNTSGSDISLGLGSVPTTVASPGRPRRPSAGTTHAPHPYTTHDSTRLSMEDRKRRQRSSKSTDHTPHSPPLSPLLHLALHHSISQERLAAEILTLESAPPSVPTSPRKLSDPSSEHDVLSVDNTTRNMDAGMASVSCSSTSATAAEPPSSSFAVLSPSTSNTNATPRTVNAPRGATSKRSAAAAASEAAAERAKILAKSLAKSGEIIKKQLSAATNPMRYLEEFRARNALSLSVCQNAFPLLDVHGVSRARVHQSLLGHLKSTLLARVTELPSAKLDELLDSSFPYIFIPELKEIPFAIMDHHPSIPVRILKALVKKPDVIKELPLNAKRQLWRHDVKHFEVEVMPLIATFVCDSDVQQSALNMICANSVSPRKRREHGSITALATIVAHSRTLYHTLVQLLRGVYCSGEVRILQGHAEALLSGIETGGCRVRTDTLGSGSEGTENEQQVTVIELGSVERDLVCAVRAAVLMALHDEGGASMDIVRSDEAYRFAWCLNACIRDGTVEETQIQLLRDFFDNAEAGPVIGEIGMILCDPFAAHTIHRFLFSIVVQLTQPQNQLLPQVDGSLVYLSTLVSMGPLALSMFSSSRFAVPPVDIVLLTRFMPLLSELLVDDQIRLLLGSDKLPDRPIPNVFAEYLSSNYLAQRLFLYYTLHSVSSANGPAVSRALSLIPPSFLPLIASDRPYISSLLSSLDSLSQSTSDYLIVFDSVLNGLFAKIILLSQWTHKQIVVWLCQSHKQFSDEILFAFLLKVTQSLPKPEKSSALEEAYFELIQQLFARLVDTPDQGAFLLDFVGYDE